MRRARGSVSLLRIGLATALGLASLAAAAADIFLRLEGIPGESTDKVHKDEIELLSYRHLFHTGSPDHGSGSGKPTCGDLVVTKQIDRSSPLLISHLLRGAVIRSGEITFRAAGSAAPEYYKVRLADVTVTAVEQTDQADPQRIAEKVSLRARTFNFEYRPVTPKGTPGTVVKFGWDCVKNAPL